MSVAYYFGLEPLPDQKGMPVQVSQGNIATSNTLGCYINTPVAGTLAATTVGITDRTTSILGSAQAFKGATTDADYQYLTGAETEVILVTVSDTRNLFVAAADGTLTPGTTYGFTTGEDDAGSTVTGLSSARVDNTNGSSTANTLMCLAVVDEPGNTTGAGTRYTFSVNNKAIFA